MVGDPTARGILSWRPEAGEEGMSMAAKKKSAKTVTIELELDVLKKLVEAAEALSELASATIIGCDDPKVRALGKRLAKKGKKTRR
jgi:hypothetical protein